MNIDTNESIEQLGDDFGFLGEAYDMLVTALEIDDENSANIAELVSDAEKLRDAAEDFLGACEDFLTFALDKHRAKKARTP